MPFSPLYSNSALINWLRPRLLFNPAGLLLLLLELIQHTVKQQGFMGNFLLCNVWFYFRHNMTLMDAVMGICTRVVIFILDIVTFFCMLEDVVQILSRRIELLVQL